MKTLKTFSLVSVLVFGMTTSVFASWWNPFTWFQTRVVTTVERDPVNNSLPVSQEVQKKEELKVSQLEQVSSTAESKHEVKNVKLSKNDMDINEIGYKVDYDYTTGSDGSVKSQQLVFASPSKVRSVVPIKIATQISSAIRFQETKKNGGEDLTGELMAINPLNQNQIIISTHTADESSRDSDGNFSFLNKVYLYDLKNHELKLLATNEDKDNIYRELVIIGSQSTKIIFFSHTIGSGGPCGSSWLYSTERYSYLDMGDLGAGLKTYLVPEVKIQKEKVISKKCEENL